MSIIVDGEQLDFNVVTPKKKLFINVSNHPSSTWSESQRNAAQKFGEIIDVTFPAVDPNCDERQINELSESGVNSIDLLMHYHKVDENSTTISVVGEFSLTVNLVNMLHRIYPNMRIVVATSERNTILNPDGTKTIKFEFCKFRNLFYTPFKRCSVSNG